jgi:DNA repair photolyase
MAKAAHPRLFPLDLRPTTRDIAAVVKAGGAEALTEAQRRADDARYQEVRCRSALNHVEGMPFRWTLNPYRGCTHACEYCFARRYHAQFELGAGDAFSSVILVKTNLVEVLRRELDRPSWARELVAVGTATDPYQPIEGHYRLTRAALEALADAETPIGLVTKGPMVVRDADVLARLSAGAGCTVYMSVPSIDEDAWRRLEPGTAHPIQRLRAVRTLVERGVRTGVLMAPLVPGITTGHDHIAATMEAIKAHGADFVGANVLRLEGGTREHFLAFLSREYPELSESYGDLYAGSRTRARPEFVAAVHGAVRLLQARAGLTGREPADTRHEGPAPMPRQPAAQPRFSWDVEDEPAGEPGSPAGAMPSATTRQAP